VEELGIRVFWLLFGITLASSFAFGALQCVALTMLWRRPRKRPLEDALPGISVLKPIKGADAGLRANLEAFLDQEYPEYEILVGVKDPEDPAIPVIRAVMCEHPRAPVRLVLGAAATGMNPKVNNLSNLVRHARHEHLLISDADVRPRPGYLRGIASELGGGAGLVHNVLVGTEERRLGAVLESLHMNSFVATTLCAAHQVGHSCVVGKSMLFKRSDLEQIGGFAAVENVLAEDYVLGQRFQRSGFRVSLSLHALPVVNPDRSLAGFFNRQLRWAQMRRRLSLRAYLAEVLGNPIAWLAVWSPWVVLAPPGSGGASLWLVVSGAVLSTKLAGDLALSRTLRGDFGALRNLPWTVVKDLLVAAVWFVGLFKRRINWRGSVRWIGPQSRLGSSPRDRGALADALQA